MGNRKAFDPGNVRTVALVGHRSSGRTSLAEVLLRVAGVTRSVGSVDQRTSLLDHHEEERRRGLTLQLSYAWLEWGAHQINLVDTPGTEAAAQERALGVMAADALVVAVDAVAGVQVGTELALDEARGAPALVVVTKLDRAVEVGALDGVGFEAVLEEIEAAVEARVVPLFLPFVEEGRLRGLVSVLDEQVLRFDPDGSGAFSPEPVPIGARAALRIARDRLADAVAMTDDALLEHYLEYLELPRDLLERGLARAVRHGRVVPVVPTSAARRVGAQQLLDAIARWLPSPVERAVRARDADGAEVIVAPDGEPVAQVVSAHLDEAGELYHVVRVWGGGWPKGGWSHVPTGQRRRVQKLYQIRGPRRAAARTVGAGALLATWELTDVSPGDTLTGGARLELPVPRLPTGMMSYLVRPAGHDRDRGRPEARERAAEALERAAEALARRDLALAVEPAAGGVRLSGLSDAHLELAVERLARLVGFDLATELPPVAYRETVAEPVRNVRGLHLRESGEGLVDEYGLCTLDVAPAPPDAGVSFHDTLPADDVDMLPAKYRPAIDEGVRRASAHGPTAGYPVVGVEVTLTGGEYDILQSTDEHFRRAGEKALRLALQRAGTRLLEPWSRLEVWCPQAAVGDLVSDIAAHRGRVLGLHAAEDRRGRGLTVRIEAVCPDRELRTFAARLQTVTHGRGRFATRHSHYEPLPRHLEREAIRSSPFLDRRPAAAELGDR